MMFAEMVAAIILKTHSQALAVLSDHHVFTYRFLPETHA
jgi:hypothetical protein